VATGELCPWWALPGGGPLKAYGWTSQAAEGALRAEAELLHVELGPGGIRVRACFGRVPRELLGEGA
jgi:hypothetical protein